MRYKCLVLDHDDTLVNSTATIHFPCFCEFLKEVRPNAKTYTLEDYFRKNFDPGILPFFTEEVGLSPQELDYEFRFWQNYVKPRVPQAFSGMREILERHKRQGGILAVVSHSMKDAIVRDYRENGLPQPDVIYGWDLPPEQRKPAPWALEQIMAQFSCPRRASDAGRSQAGLRYGARGRRRFRGGRLGIRRAGDRGVHAQKLRLLF